MTEWVVAPYQAEEFETRLSRRDTTRVSRHARERRPGALSALLAGTAWAWIGFEIVMLVVVGVGRIAVDGPTYAIVSGSMAPAIPVGSVVVAETADPNLIKVNDIISFRAPRTDGGIITHRVVAIDEGAVTTRGDANQNADSTPVAAGDITGRVRIVVPYVGLPAAWFRHGEYLALGLWLGANALALWAVGLDRRARRRHAARVDHWSGSSS